MFVGFLYLSRWLKEFSKYSESNFIKSWWFSKRNCFQSSLRIERSTNAPDYSLCQIQVLFAKHEIPALANAPPLQTWLLTTLIFFWNWRHYWKNSALRVDVDMRSAEQEGEVKHDFKRKKYPFRRVFGSGKKLELSIWLVPGSYFERHHGTNLFR